MGGTPAGIPEAADVVVIGGGINGISAFRELALQGVDVVLLERADFCAGASAALSRMVHGGLRYLENGEFRLVRESLVERDRLLRNAPHLISPLPTIIPVTAWASGSLATLAGFLGSRRRAGPRPGLMVRLGLTLYDLLSWRDRTMPRHQGLGAAQIRRLVPGLTRQAVGGVLYHDARVSLPERLGVEMILDIEARTAARAFNYVELAGRDGEALVWRDRLTEATGHIRPRLVVNAAGAWVDRVEAVLGPGTNHGRVQGTKGSHLVIRNAALGRALADHMIYYENRDGRICIAFNHFGASVVGSTDIRIDDPDQAICLEDEKDYMLAALAQIFPDIAVEDHEIVHVFSGVRPLPSSDVGPTSRISRDHSIDEGPPGEVKWPVLTLIGGKWTTFRAFGAEVADLALSRLGLTRRQGTEDLPIGGGRDFPVGREAQADWIRGEAAAAGLEEVRFAALAARYGSRAREAVSFMAAGPDSPIAAAPGYSRRELLWIIANEHVRDVSDLLLRRTSLGIEGRADDALIGETAALLAEALGWDGEARRQAVSRTCALLALHHRVQPSR